MKKLFLVFVLIFISLFAIAKLLSFGVQPYMSLPIGSFDDQAQNGMGIKGILFIHPIKFIDIYGGIGFEKWDNDNNSNVTKVYYSNIPLFAGFRFYPMQLYGLPAVPGKFFISFFPTINMFKITTETTVFGNTTTSTNEDNFMGFSAGVGYVIYLKKIGFSVSSSYKYINTDNTDVNAIDISLTLLFKIL